MKSILSFLLHYPFTMWQIARLRKELDTMFAEMDLIERAIVAHMAVDGWDSALDDLKRDLEEVKRRYQYLTEEQDLLEERYEQRRIAAICALEGKQHDCTNDE